MTGGGEAIFPKDTLTFAGLIHGDIGKGYDLMGTAVSKALAEAIGIQVGAPDADEAVPIPEAFVSEGHVLRSLTRSGAERLGHTARVFTLEDAGYVITLDDDRFDPKLPLHLTDFDDTSIATMKAKSHVREDYAALLQSHGLEIGSEGVRGITDAADQFARWDEQGHRVHHLDAHYAALSWATRTLLALRGFAAGEVASHVIDVLNKLTPLQKGNTVNAGPAFDRVGDRLVEAEHNLITPEMTSIFMRFIRPDPFENSIATYREAQSSGLANTGIWSYGVPPLQLMKVFARLMDEQETHGDGAWRPPVLLLTKVIKGEYIQRLAAQTQLDSPLGELARNVLACPDITLFDDDPKQLDSVTGITSAGPRVRVVRSIQKGTKTEERHPEWNRGEVVDLRKDGPEALQRVLGGFTLSNG